MIGNQNMNKTIDNLVPIEPYNTEQPVIDY